MSEEVHGQSQVLACGCMGTCACLGEPYRDAASGQQYLWSGVGRVRAKGDEG